MSNNTTEQKENVYPNKKGLIEYLEERSNWSRKANFVMEFGNDEIALGTTSIIFDIHLEKILRTYGYTIASIYPRKGRGYVVNFKPIGLEI